LSASLEESLIARARAAAQFAYAPHSGFRVGAAALADDGRVFSGCNVESASYGLTLCAERTAIVAGVAAGVRRFRGLAVSCIDAAPDAGPEARTPCGACRQFLSEFLADDAPIEVDGVGVFTLRELFPLPFRLEGGGG